EETERRHDAANATEEQAAPAPSVAARQVARTRDEVDRLDEAASLVGREDDDLAAKGNDVIGAAAAREAHLGPLIASDDGGVQIAVAVDLRAADEADVQEAALGHEEDVRDAGQHLSAMGGAYLVGGDRQPSGLPLRPDDSALHHDREIRGLQTLSQHGGHHRRTHSGEDHLAILQLACPHDREQLVRRDVLLCAAHVSRWRAQGASARARSRALPRAAWPKSPRTAGWVAGP